MHELEAGPYSQFLVSDGWVSRASAVQLPALRSLAAASYNSQNGQTLAKNHQKNQALVGILQRELGGEQPYRLELSYVVYHEQHHRETFAAAR